MNRFQAMAQIMAMLDRGRKTHPSRVANLNTKLSRKLVSDKIDRLGPETALQRGAWIRRLN
jgi:hypothetical protein